MRGNNLNDLKNNINNAEDKNKTDSGEKIAPIGRNLCIALVALCVVNTSHILPAIVGFPKTCRFIGVPMVRSMVMARVP